MHLRRTSRSVWSGPVSTGRGSLANVLEENGTPARTVTADATVHLVQGDDGFAIPRVDLTCVGVVPGVGAEDFRRMAAEAEAGCPVSKLLDAEVVLDARLAEAEAAG